MSAFLLKRLPFSANFWLQFWNENSKPELRIIVSSESDSCSYTPLITFHVKVQVIQGSSLVNGKRINPQFTMILILLYYPSLSCQSWLSLCKGHEYFLFKNITCIVFLLYTLSYKFGKARGTGVGKLPRVLSRDVTVDYLLKEKFKEELLKTTIAV